MTSTIKVDNVQDTDGNNIINENANTITIGASGDTVTIPSGATINNQGTAVNFGATGSASWSTTVKTSSPFTAVAGEGYFVNTTGGAITVNLPAGTAGAVVAIKDYAGTFDTNAVTLVQNGSDKIGGSTDNKRLNTEGIAATLIFIDSTQGWLVTDDGLQSTAAALTYTADFLIIGGGGGSAMVYGGGGGAGGYRNSFGSETSGGGGSSESSLNLSVGATYTATIGAGGSGATNYGGGAPGNEGITGDNTTFSGSGITTITSLGGGGGAKNESTGKAGGSGGGAGSASTGGSGTANQGFNGGSAPGPSGYSGGGGGGAGAVGLSSSPSSTTGVAGGAGLSSSITGSSVARGGGGGGGAPGSGSAGPGGTGGGGGTAAGTANTGGGGGASKTYVPASPASSSAFQGGSGVVIISMADADYSGTVTGSPTVATGVSGKTVITFNSTGTYTG